MASSPLRVAVVGAGIGGLTLAIALRERGIPVQVYEQATELGAPAVSREAIDTAVVEAGLNEGQEKAFRSILASGRRMEVVAAPAGTGKSRLAGAIHDVWTQEVGPVIGLTVSQRAARVLAEEGVRNAQNVAKFLDTNRRLGSGQPVAEDERAAFQLQPGQLVLCHSSLMGLGRMEDGARGVAACFMDVLGPSGTLIVRPDAVKRGGRALPDPTIGPLLEAAFSPTATVACWPRPGAP